MKDYDGGQRMADPPKSSADLLAKLKRKWKKKTHILTSAVLYSYKLVARTLVPAFILLCNSATMQIGAAVGWTIYPLHSTQIRSCAVDIAISHQQQW